MMSVASVQLTQHRLEFRGVQLAVAVGVELGHQLFGSRAGGTSLPWLVSATRLS